MPAKIRKNISLPDTLIPRTKEYHYSAPMPAGLDDNHIKWREKPLKNAQKPNLWRPKRQKWTDDEREDIQRRHDRGEKWDEIAEDYGTTYGSVRAAVDKRRS